MWVGMGVRINLRGMMLPDHERKEKKCNWNILMCRDQCFSATIDGEVLHLFQIKGMYSIFLWNPILQVSDDDDLTSCA